MPDHSALWLPAKRSSFAVGSNTYARPQPDEIVVRNRAVAVNPVDRLLPTIGDFVFPWLQYPVVPGSDLAGEVVEVGSNVTRFRVGDRVLGHALGIEKGRSASAEGAFQSFTIVLEHMASPLPASLSFEEAAVLPLGLSTAACGLFQRDFIGLPPPVMHPEPINETILVWGGSTSVGSNAIQLARAAGYDVVATASSHNFEYVKRLGAHAVIDYRSPDAISKLTALLQGRRVAGMMAIGAGSAAACLKVATACTGRRFIATTTPPVSFDEVPRGKGRMRKLLPIMTRVLLGNVGLMLKARQLGISMRMIWGGSLWANEVGPMIYQDFLPTALAEQRYKAAPAPQVVGNGLEQLPVAVELHRKGVSARKLVVRL